MPAVSILIPAREEPFLIRTVTDLLQQARGDIEILVLLDGWEPEEPLPADARVRTIHWVAPVGLRAALNAGAEAAHGRMLMKIDAHCAVSPGYDVTLAGHCFDGMIVVPQKFSLDPETWTKYNVPWQYFYLTYPWAPDINHPGLHDKNCDAATNERYADQYPLDDILSYQGSCWCLTKRHWQKIGPMDAAHYYVAQEPQELGLATWLSGGRCVIAKDVWYAHLHKGRSHRRGFRIDKGPWVRALRWSAEHWMAQPGMAALVERFWPLLAHCEFGPWPEDWQDPKYHAAMVARLAGAA